MDYEIKLNSLYICVKNMKRACDFYESILGIPTEKDHVGLFILGGFRFLLFDNEEVGEKVVYGDNCLPSFEVSDIRHMKINNKSKVATDIFHQARR